MTVPGAGLTIVATGPMGPIEELAPLERAGHRVVIGRPLGTPKRQAYTEDELVALCREADIVLASHLETISARVLEAAPRLRLAIVPFIGVDKIDVAAATRLGVLVANGPTQENFVAVAEATVGLVLMLLKRIKHNEAKLRRGEWAVRSDRGDFLFGKTVGLVGLGRVGTHVARRLAGWDVRLLASDPYVTPERAAAHGVSLVDLPTLLAEADVVSLHATLTDETRGLIGEKELRRMKPTALLINTARGEVLDEEALARALEEGWIAGAALDAFVREPLPADSVLRRVDPERLILTPHNVSHSEAGRRANLALALEQILAAARGEVPTHVINRDAIAGWRGGSTEAGGTHEQVWIVLVHGATMFGRKVMKAGDIWRRLDHLPKGLELLATVRASGNIVLKATRTFDEAELRNEVRERLGECVVIPLPVLREILREAMTTFPKCVSTHGGALRVKLEGLTWEPGLVFTSERLPESVSGSAGTLRATSKARALAILQRRALAVLKRNAPWGSVVLKPWRQRLQASSIAVGCLTSRSISSLNATIRAASVGESSSEAGR